MISAESSTGHVMILREVSLRVLKGTVIFGNSSCSRSGQRIRSLDRTGRHRTSRKAARTASVYTGEP